MDSMLSMHHKIKPEFIEIGNIDTLDEGILKDLFKDDMAKAQAVTSCAYKHYIAVKNIANQKEWCLVLEDDIALYKNFDLLMPQILEELNNRNISNAIISLEDSLPKYIPKNERSKHTLLYAREEMRLAGAYLIDASAAKNIMHFVEKNKIHLTADWFYSFLTKKGIINCFWAQPAIACQKSISGGLPSLIDNKSTGWFRRLNFWIQKNIKRLRSSIK